MPVTGAFMNVLALLQVHRGLAPPPPQMTVCVSALVSDPGFKKLQLNMVTLKGTWSFEGSSNNSAA